MNLTFKRGDVVRIKVPLMPTGTFGPLCGVECVVSSVRRTSIGVRLLRFKGWHGEFYSTDFTPVLHTPADLAMALELAQLAWDSELDVNLANWLRAEVIATLRGER